MSIIKLRIRCDRETLKKIFCFDDVSSIEKLLSSLLSNDNNFLMNIVLKV